MKRLPRKVTVLEVKRLQIYSGCVCNGHSQTDKSSRSGVDYPYYNGYVTAVAVGKGNGFILVSECLRTWFYLSSINACIKSVPNSKAKGIETWSNPLT